MLPMWLGFPVCESLNIRTVEKYKKKIGIRIRIIKIRTTNDKEHDPANSETSS